MNGVPRLPSIPLSYAGITIASTPRNKVQLAVHEFALNNQTINWKRAEFLQQIRSLRYIDVFLDMYPEGLIAVVKPEEDELDDTARCIIETAEEISREIQGDINVVLREVFEIERQKPRTFRSPKPIKALCQHIAIQERGDMLTQAKIQMTYADHERILCMTNVMLDAYKYTLSKSGIGEEKNIEESIARYKAVGKVITQTILDVKTLLLSTRIEHGQYFKTETN